MTCQHFCGVSKSLAILFDANKNSVKKLRAGKKMSRGGKLNDKLKYGA